MPSQGGIMLVRFDIREDPQGWTIYDRLTNEPAVSKDTSPSVSRSKTPMSLSTF